MTVAMNNCKYDVHGADPVNVENARVLKQAGSRLQVDITHSMVG